jgi:hypothetical protein
MVMREAEQGGETGSTLGTHRRAERSGRTVSEAVVVRRALPDTPRRTEPAVIKTAGDRYHADPGCSLLEVERGQVVVTTKAVVVGGGRRECKRCWRVGGYVAPSGDAS